MAELRPPPPTVTARDNTPDEAPDDAPPAAGVGYPRGRWPRFDGLPIPWITRLDPDGPAWAHVDLPMVLNCQINWRCQVCGRPLSTTAWVALSAGRDVLSDTAMHHACALIALRWCPHLIDSRNDVEVVEVGFGDIHADGVPLPAITDYGDAIRDWVVEAVTGAGSRSCQPDTQ